MVNDNRRNQIVDIVRKKNSVSCIELSKILNVTPETIRRDLTYLDEKGLLKRTHGGAVASPEEISNSESRILENFDMKKAIAKKAAAFIEEKDVLFFDAGTTTFLLCENIPDDKELFVITNSKKCIDKLIEKEKINIISSGGLLRRKTMAFVGSSAEQTIHSHALKKAFISALAVSTEFGILDSHYDEAGINKIAISKAVETYLLVDSSKFNKIAYINVAPLDSVTAIITDNKLDDSIKEELRQLNINVIIADE